MTVRNSSKNAIPVDELAIPLVRYLTTKVRNDEDANDLAQEALLRMHKFQQSGSVDNARAFLYRTAKNLVVDQMRRDQVHDRYVSAELAPREFEQDDEKFAPSAERTVSAEQELDRINETVDTMPPKVRRAFLLHRGRDLSYAEIARDMEVSTSMVEKYIAEALRMLRRELQQ